MTTKDYSRLFLDLIPRLARSLDEGSASVVVDFLAEQTSESRSWPSDSQVREAILELPLYQLLTRGRLRMLLEGIEDKLRSPKTEDAHVARGLTIEHVMPQAWRTYWPLHESDDPAAPEKRDRILHTLGNLTLLTANLNPGLSNGPWSEKKAGLDEFSVLELKKSITGSPFWNEATIRARGALLADHLIGLWPRPA